MLSLWQFYQEIFEKIEGNMNLCYNISTSSLLVKFLLVV